MRAEVLPKPYMLASENNSSRAFYNVLKHFTDEVLERASAMPDTFFSLYNENEYSEINDYILDVLILGVLYAEYGRSNLKFLSIKKYLLKFLFTLRKYPGIKNRIDALRGKVAWKWLKPTSFDSKISGYRLCKTIDFLVATSEYREEVSRITGLKNQLLDSTKKKSTKTLQTIVDFAFWFKRTAKSRLGKYTSGVETFLDRHHENYKGKENYFFCARKESEYHLNMVGAEIMNRGLRKQFHKAEEKILLLPSCMSPSTKCRAKEQDRALICLHCNQKCNISHITREMRKEGVKTVIIKHSSSFSKWLKPWANQKKTALIGVACVLNLLTGGFEMKRQRIPSQCIFLDFPGCRKHWKSCCPGSIDLLTLKNICNNRSSHKLNSIHH
jgi:hypothetical protein